MTKGSRKPAPTRDPIREQLALAVSWHAAHVSFDDAVTRLPAALRGRRVRGFPHSIWELVEHIRRAQRDILDFCRAGSYAPKTWPDDYWPDTAAPRSAAAWTASLAAVRRDRRALQRLSRDRSHALVAHVPHGTGQSYIHEILLVIDHTAYHVGQIVALRQQVGAWPAR